MIIWFILIGIPMLFGLYAQMRVMSAYNKNVQIPSRGRITGREAAEAVMHRAGIHDVEIVEVPGHLTDHYNPMTKRLALSSENYHGTSLAALGVSAHEAGHAIQHKVGYSMMKFRQVIVPAVQFVSPMANYGLLIAILLIGLLGAKVLGLLVLQLAAIALAAVTFFHLVTLPVEFDASRRAKLELVNLGILDRDEMPGVEDTLGAAALTYVAAFVASLGSLLHVLMILGGVSRSNDD
ncbi:MAG TPA: zinc metallopeptidase [Opitutaceae bacterium]|nr:zinc metallopeptidase [Opitutaceae bacterium]HOG92296.1 zinc metallopeptidase [Opitutaceae bacterium]HPN99857.1 zinc metallopeptidase [Opitutaceae bacterium]HQL20136.1 zinc metallopeptidase [Opitutaceae bacterium]